MVPAPCKNPAHLGWSDLKRRSTLESRMKPSKAEKSKYLRGGGRRPNHNQKHYNLRDLREKGESPLEPYEFGTGARRKKAKTAGLRLSSEGK